MSEIDAALRAFVRSRAAGLCEYCRIPERLTLAEHQIDHITAVKHGGVTTDQNLALCCAPSNKFKGSDIASIDPETGLITPLFNPRFDQWPDHFRYSAGEILGITPQGRATTRLLRMNRQYRIKERKLLPSIQLR